MSGFFCFTDLKESLISIKLWMKGENCCFDFGHLHPFPTQILSSHLKNGDDDAFFEKAREKLFKAFQNL